MTDRGNRSLFNNVEIIAVPNMTAEVCTSSVQNEFISRWGWPLTIHSNQDRSHDSNVFKELCRMLEI